MSKVLLVLKVKEDSLDQWYEFVDFKSTPAVVNFFPFHFLSFSAYYRDQLEVEGILGKQDQEEVRYILTLNL